MSTLIGASHTCDVINGIEGAETLNRYILLRCESPVVKNISTTGKSSVTLIAF